jgi:hypothetical protein
VISEQPDPSLFDDRQAFIAIIVDDVDRDPGDLRRRRSSSGKCSTEIGKHLVRLSRKITTAHQITLQVFGLLARYEYQLAACRNDDLAVRLRNRQIVGVDALERHFSSLLCSGFNRRIRLNRSR